MRKRVAIISQIHLPIPDVKGGGIELLTRLIIEQNEIEKKYDLLVYSIYDEEAEKISKKYKYCKIIYIKVNKLFRVYDGALNRILRLLKRRYIANRTYYNRVYNKIKDINDLEAVVFEAGPVDVIEKFRETFSKNLIFHSHGRQFPNYRKYIYDKVITVSDFCKKDWLNVYKSKNVFVVRNGIDSSNIERKMDARTATNLREQLKIDEDDFIVVYVGRIVPIKGVLELVSAWKFIDNPKIKILVIGSLYQSFGGEYNYSHEVEYIAKSDKRIFLMDYVENHHIYKYMQLADVQVIPTTGDEAAGLVAIEGMASGLPIIITDSGGLPEYCKGESTIIVRRDENFIEELAKAIIKVYNTPEMKYIAKREQKNALTKYSPKNYYKQYFYAVLGID